MTISKLLAGLLAASVLTSAAQAGEGDLPRDLEMRLALSALPERLRDGASVYLLDPANGYELARAGDNGFHAYVKRVEGSAFAGDWDFAAFPEHVIVPVAFDEAGAEAIMPVDFDVAKMRAGGVSAREVKRIVNNRYENGDYGPPARAGVSYMISPIIRTYLAPDLHGDLMTASYPHYMFYAPNVSNDEIAGDPTGPHPYIISEGPHGYIIIKAGEAETRAIIEEHQGLLDDLCAHNGVWCLPDR